MKKSLLTGLGGAQPSPNLLSYGNIAPSTVCKLARHLNDARHNRSTHAAFFTCPPLIITCIVALLLAFHFCTPLQAFAAQAQSTDASKSPLLTRQKLAAKTTNTAISKPSPRTQQRQSGKGKKNAPKAAAPHADVWAFSTQKARPVDSIWTQGLAPQALKNAAVTSLKDKALKKGLNAPEIPPVLPPKTQAEKDNRTQAQGSQLRLGRGMPLRGDFDTVSSSWHSSGLKHEPRIDQDFHRQETTIYGAYADLEAGDDFTLSAGPEFSHTRTQGATQGSTHSQSESSSLGLGVQLKWDF